MNVVDLKHDNEWHTLINLDNDFNQFREIHISVTMARVWTFLTRIAMNHYVGFENVCVKTSLLRVSLASVHQKCVVSGGT